MEITYDLLKTEGEVETVQYDEKFNLAQTIYFYNNRYYMITEDDLDTVEDVTTEYLAQLVDEDLDSEIIDDNLIIE